MGYTGGAGYTSWSEERVVFDGRWWHYSYPPPPVVLGRSHPVPTNGSEYTGFLFYVGSRGDWWLTSCSRCQGLV